MNQAKQLKHLAGFTLLELMVAVVVLLVVMIAVGRIFTTTSAVSASGVAISETLQQAVAIEQQLREDIAKISDDGFMAIRHVAVPNNIYQYILIDDTQPEEAIIRFDQLVFIRLGTTTPVGLRNSGAGDFAGQTFASTVYYGHGVSFPDLMSYDQGGNTVNLEDPELLITDFTEDPVITPWYQGTVDFNTLQYTGSQNTMFDDLGMDGTTNGTQQLPSKWMLCRQATAMGDDDQYDRDAVQKTRFALNGLSTHSIFPADPRFNEIDPHVQRGRVDIVSTHLGDVRQSILNNFDSQGLPTDGRPWSQLDTSSSLDQQELIATLLQWPRIEAMPPSPFRNDQMLMMHGLAQGVVSFQVEWMYKEGLGRATSADGVVHSGYEYANNYSQPWFGASYREDPDDPTSLVLFDTLGKLHNLSINTADWNAGNYDPYVDYVASEAVWSYPINPDDEGNVFLPTIERQFIQGEGPDNALIPIVRDSSVGINEYWSIFGYNGTEPFAENQLDFLNNGFMSYAWRYTPRPSALRVTMRLLDRENRLGVGWTYQFIVDLPEAIR